MNRLVYVLIFVVLNVGNVENSRRKRDEVVINGGGLLDSLKDVINSLKEAFVGPQKPGALNDAFVPNSLTNDRPYKAPSILEAVGFCKTDQIDCDFISCLATNFKNSEMAQSIKKGSKVLLDPGLRRTLLDDPTIMKAACESQNMNEMMCNMFKQFLGLFDKIDPPSAHKFDEPRDKREAALPQARPDTVVVQIVPRNNAAAPVGPVAAAALPARAAVPAPAPAVVAVPKPAPAPAPAASGPAPVLPVKQPVSATASASPSAAQPSALNVAVGPPSKGSSRGNGFGRAKSGESKGNGREKSRENKGNGESNKGSKKGTSDYDYYDHGHAHGSGPGGVTGSPSGGGGGGNGSGYVKRNCRAERQAAVLQRDAAKLASQSG